MENVILTTPEQLASIVEMSIKRVLDSMPGWHIPQKHQPERMNIEQASEYLSENGFLLSISGLRKFVFNKEVPYQKFGGKVIFNRSELLDWASSRISSNKKENAAASTLAISAKRQSTSKR